MSGYKIESKGEKKNHCSGFITELPVGCHGVFLCNLCHPVYQNQWGYFHEDGSQFLSREVNKYTISKSRNKRQNTMSLADALYRHMLNASNSSGVSISKKVQLNYGKILRKTTRIDSGFCIKKDLRGFFIPQTKWL